MTGPWLTGAAGTCATVCCDAAKRRAARIWSLCDTMWYLSKMERVRWPVISVATLSGTPALTMLRTAVRLMSCRSRPAGPGAPTRRRSVTNEQLEAKKTATEQALRKEWGKNYERNMTKAYALADAFELRFSHDDLEKAIDNGLWADADVLRTLAGVANARNGIRADIHAMRAELLKANQGSPRYRELTAALERHYQALHGTGS